MTFLRVSLQLAVALAVGLATMARVSTASAGPPEPEPIPRLFAGLETGLLWQDEPWIDGRRAESDGGIHLGIQAGYGGTLTHAFGWLAVARAAGHSPSYTGDHVRFDLALGPELRIKVHPELPRGGLRFALPLGGSWTTVEGTDGRLVRQRYSGGFGMHVGSMLGFDLSQGNHGAYVDLAWTMHVTWFELTSTANLPAPRQVHEAVRTMDHVVTLTTGYMYLL